MEIIAQAVRVIDYENNSVQRRNVNMMPKFKDYIEQLIVHVSNNVSIREYHTQSTRTEVIAGILEIAGNLETPDAIEEKIDSIAEILDDVKDGQLEKMLVMCKEGHEKLQKEIQMLLEKYHDTGKNPNPMAQSMSWKKPNEKLAMEDTDATVADLITDGCNMGVKSLSRYLNQYKAADEQSINFANCLIQLEEGLSVNMRSYL